MKKTHSFPSLMGSFFVIVHFLLALATSAASEQFPDQIDGLRIEAHRAVLSTQDGEGVLLVHAGLYNEGIDDLTVLTKTGASTARDATGVVLGFSFTGRSRLPNGNLIIPSLHQFHPVTLRSGEAAVLVIRVSGNIIEDLNEGDVIKIQYVVWDGWGERFSIWHGAITAEVAVTVPE